MRLRSFLLLLIAGCGAAPSCSDGGSTASLVPMGPEGVRAAAGALTGGGSGDALAASVLVSSGAARPGTLRPVFAMADGALADAARFHAEAHVEATAFAVGGPRLEGSDRVRRLAASPGAPPDRNGNGTNLDETLADEQAALASLTLGALPGTYPALFPAVERSADFAAAIGSAGRRAFGALATTPSADDRISTAHLGHAMLARLLVAQQLLAASRGSRPGADPDSGLRGLLLLQEVLAIEETAMQSLFSDGQTMGRLANPATYDPLVEPARWLPATFRFTPQTAIANAPRSYTPAVVGATLAGHAAVLRAASELAWMSSAQNPNPSLRDVVTGNPFGPPPGTQRPRPTPGSALPATILPTGAGGGSGGAPVPTWEDDIKPLLHFTRGCLGCHGDPSLAPPPGWPFAGYSLWTYDLLFVPGASGLMPVVPGDHMQSRLWAVLANVNLSNPAEEWMPQGGFPNPGEYLTAAEVRLVEQWIDAGAPEKAPPPTVVPAVGEDLARVLMRNIEGMHLDAATGALHHRHDGDAPSGVAEAAATGDALLAMAAYVEAQPADARARAVLEQAADFAARRLVDAGGVVADAFDIAAAAAQGEADLHGHARLCAGLFAAGRLLGRAAVTDAARRVAGTLLRDFFAAATSLFRSRRGVASTRYTPDVVAGVLDALRETASDGAVTGAVAAHDAFLAVLRPVMVHAEWDGRGEVLGDGIADTDGNGIAEPALAGGAHGRAPVFVAEILAGPAVTAAPSNAPITWTDHILPLLRNKCATCHLSGASRGTYRVDTPTLLRTPGESGGVEPLIVPGDPAASFFYRKLADRNPAIGVQMPEALPPLNAQGLALVRQWILEGATSR